MSGIVVGPGSNWRTRLETATGPTMTLAEFPETRQPSTLGEESLLNVQHSPLGLGLRVSVGQTPLGAATEALGPLIVDGRLREADLHRTVDALRLPARFFADLVVHLQSLGVTVFAPDDEEDDGSGFDRKGLAVFLECAGRHPILTAEDERRLAGVLAEGRLAQEWLDSGQVPEEAVADFRRKVRAGEEAGNEFIRCNFKLVVSIVKKFQARGLELDDLIQEGHFGLATAVRKFDSDLGYRFSTYATWWIRQGVQRAIADYGSAIGCGSPQGTSSCLGNGVVGVALLVDSPSFLRQVIAPVVGEVPVGV
jgi:hypothetical protein